MTASTVFYVCGATAAFDLGGRVNSAKTNNAPEMQ